MNGEHYGHTMTLLLNPCYRARREIAHAEHRWTNGIEVQYYVRCPGFRAIRGPYDRARTTKG